MSEESEAHQDLTIKALRARIAELEKKLELMIIANAAACLENEELRAELDQIHEQEAGASL